MDSRLVGRERVNDLARIGFFELASDCPVEKCRRKSGLWTKLINGFL